MNLAGLIQRVRVQANDRVEPYFWSDQDITDWLNEAVNEACIRGRLIREAANPDVCQIDVTAGTSVYPLHESLYELTHVSIQEAGGRRCQLTLLSPEHMDATVHQWRTLEPAMPRYAIQEDTTLRLVPEPLQDAEVQLEGYRLPLEPLDLDVADTSTPEIHAAHHLHLIQWALFRGFSMPDMEAFDPARADKAEDEFTKYFGLRPDSDLRRITREDVPHTVEAFWP